MRKALIGHSGFVGGFLASRMPFTDTYRRSNIDEARGQAFDLVICAGMPAAKWLANKDPEADRQNTDRLISVLSSIHAKTFVLISTVDIYQNGESCSEATFPRPDHAYGENRFRLESFVKSNFTGHHIVRLPALFGEGLRKNALYDLIHDNQLEKINPDSEFQWYSLEWLPGDIMAVVENGIREANLFTQPIPMRIIQQALFPGKKLNPSAPLARYDHKTILADFNHQGEGIAGYRAPAEDVLLAMKQYVQVV